MPSPQKGQIPWPPQSPQDCLALSPKRNRLNTPSRREVSPSPSRPRNGSALRHSALSYDPDSMDEDEDEEMLQLKLQQIEAKLRLKRLQSKKVARTRSTPGFTSGAAAEKEQEENAVLVPASPPRRPVEKIEPKSPARVLLGLDKGLSSRDVSLKRAPSLRNGLKSGSATEIQKPIKSFNERLKESREAELERKAKEKRIEQARSKGFTLNVGPEIGAARTATNGSGINDLGGSFGNNMNSSFGNNMNTSFGSIASSQGTEEKRKYLSSRHTGTATAQIAGPPSVNSRVDNSKDPPRATSLVRSDSKKDESTYCAYSALHLAHRKIPHIDLTRILTGKAVYQIPQILKTVVAPEFNPPDVESDWVLFGIIASKSDPRAVKQDPSNKNPPTKYQVTTLCDLKWEIELILFGDAFKKYNVLPVGTVIAILNPDIMRPRDPNSNKFTLSLNSSEETILEVGHSRDLGTCKSIKKTGDRCSTWVDRRHTDFCEFHVQLDLQKTRSARPELANTGKLFDPQRPGSNSSFGAGKSFNFRSNGGGGNRLGSRASRDSLLPDNPNVFTDLPTRLGGAGGKVYLAPPTANASMLLDDPFSGGNDPARLAKRLAEKQKEREIAAKLVQSAQRVPGRGGVGASYLAASAGISTGNPSGRGLSSAEERSRSGISTAAIIEGLGKRVAEEVKLSPVRKKKKVEFAVDEGKEREVRERRMRIWESVAAQGGGESDEDDGLEFI